MKFLIVFLALMSSIPALAYVKVCGTLNKQEESFTGPAKITLQTNKGEIELDGINDILASTLYDGARYCVGGEEDKTFSGKPLIHVMIIDRD